MPSFCSKNLNKLFPINTNKALPRWLRDKTAINELQPPPAPWRSKRSNKWPIPTDRIDKVD